MRRHGLSLRKAARTGGLALSSLSHHLDINRICRAEAQPKRGVNRATLLQLRAIPWLGCLSMYVLDSILRRSAPR